MAEPAGVLWWRRWAARTGTVRVRTTLAASAVVAVALAVAAVALVVVMRRTLLDQLAATAELRAEELAQQLDDGVAPALSTVDDDEQLVQVVDEAGRVVAASDGADELPPLAPPDGHGAPPVDVPLDDDEDDVERFVVAAEEADGPVGDVTVLVAVATEPVDDAVAVATDLVVRGAPLLVVVAALTTWVATGRALRPVEAARREVDALSASALHRRLPEPAGRDEIGRLIATMNRLLARLEGSQARQRRFVSDASHELRSPVATLRQHAEVALAHPSTTTTAELAARWSPRPCAWAASSTTCWCWPGPTRAGSRCAGSPPTSTTSCSPRRLACGRPPGCGSTPPACPPHGSTATRRRWGGWCATWWTTPPATPAAPWPWCCARAAARSPTPVAAALAAAGGGRVVEADRDDGGYDVEVLREDGTRVEFELDDTFAITHRDVDDD